MNLHHRLADGNHQKTLDVVIKRISYPVNLIIPLALTLVSFLSVKDYFGGSWDIGNFSSGFWSILSSGIARWLNVEAQAVLGTLVLILYAVGPLTMYVFVYGITKRHLPAIITSILMQLPLFPLSGLPPPRLTLALVGGDGAHIAGLSLMPLTSLMFLEYLRSQKSAALVAFSIVAAVMTSVSFFSVYILAIVMLFVTISEVLIDQGKLKVKRFLKSLLVLGVVMVVVYNRTLINMAVSAEGQTTIQVFLNFLPLSFFLVPILGTFFFLVFDRRPNLQPIFISLSLTILFWIFHWIRVAFVNAPLFDQDRYGAEVSVFFAFVMGVVFTVIFDLIRGGFLLTKFKLGKEQRLWVAYGFMTIILISILSSLLFINRSI